jgi:Xaa-Pro aminopeptidase
LKPDANPRLDGLLRKAGCDALICRLPENVTYLTGVQPVLGLSAVFYRPGQPTQLLHPSFEEHLLTSSDGVMVFPTGHLGDPSFDSACQSWLIRLKESTASEVRKLAIELDFGLAAPAFNSTEAILPNLAWREIVRSAFPGSECMDAIPLLEEARAIKSITEIERLRKASQIARMGLNILECVIQPGISEVEAAAMVESAIRVQGTGYEGTRLVQGFAQVTAGVDGTYRQSMLTPSSPYHLQDGDLVMIELGVCADGYWSDLTRVYCVGRPNSEQRRIYNAIRDAQQYAVDALRADATWGDPDRAARDHLTKQGLGSYFKHGTGHGIGCRYHEKTPQLGPGRNEVLQAGMVTSVEPGVYIPGFGGIRIEDNLVVTHGAPEWLSEPVKPW